jgi:hypothetical protein
MRNAAAVKAALVIGLFAAPALARSSDDFMPRAPSLKQSGHWEWAWDGSDGLGIGVSGATVHYVSTGPARIVITGPDKALDQLRVGQGEIRWCEDCHGSKGLDITVSGVTLHNVALGGADIDIQLGRLDQDRLNLSLAGTGQISAAGRIDSVRVSLAGSGNVRMDDTKVQRANINIAGSGDVAVSPKEEANVHVAGSGRVRMTAMPARLNQSITGSGGVRLVGN